MDCQIAGFIRCLAFDNTWDRGETFATAAGMMKAYT
jgi:hypothetical protein